MGYFKSDLLKVLTLLTIVLFAFTSGRPKEDTSVVIGLLDKCISDMRKVFITADSTLIDLVKDAIRYNRIDDERKIEYISEDVKGYFKKMYTSVTAENIELKENFCRKLHEADIKENLKPLTNANYTDCTEYLKAFEVKDPIEIKEITSTALRQHMSPEIYKLKEKVLYNALYHHQLKNHKEIQQGYGYAYLWRMINRVQLIDDADNRISPVIFCCLNHGIKNNEAGTSSLCDII